MTLKEFVRNEIEGWKKLEVAWLLIEERLAITTVFYITMMMSLNIHNMVFKTTCCECFCLFFIVFMTMNKMPMMIQ